MAVATIAQGGTAVKEGGQAEFRRAATRRGDIAGDGARFRLAMSIFREAVRNRARGDGGKRKARRSRYHRGAAKDGKRYRPGRYRDMKVSTLPERVPGRTYGRSTPSEPSPAARGEKNAPVAMTPIDSRKEALYRHRPTRT